MQEECGEFNILLLIEREKFVELVATIEKKYFVAYSGQWFASVCVTVVFPVTLHDFLLLYYISDTLMNDSKRRKEKKSEERRRETQRVEEHTLWSPGRPSW